MIAVANPAAGLLEALHNLALTPQLIAGGLVLLVVLLGAALVVRYALSGGR